MAMGWVRDQFNRGVLSERLKGKRRSDLNATLGKEGRESVEGCAVRDVNEVEAPSAGGGMFQGGAEMRSRTFFIAELLRRSYTFPLHSQSP